MNCGTALADQSHGISWFDLKLMGGFYILLVAVTVALVWTPKDMRAFFLITAVLAQGLLTIFFLSMISGQIARQFRPSRQVAIRTAQGVAGLLVLLPLNMFSTRLLSGFLGLDDGSGSWIADSMSFPTAVVAIALLPAIVEEVAFRGIFFTRLAPLVGSTQAIVLTGIIFGVIHGSIPSLPYLSVLGCFLAWLRYRSGSLIPCIAVHLIHNLMVLIYEYAVLHKGVA